MAHTVRDKTLKLNRIRNSKRVFMSTPSVRILAKISTPLTLSVSTSVNGF